VFWNSDSALNVNYIVGTTFCPKFFIGEINRLEGENKSDIT
jgi:hypothetical protein